MSKKSMVESDAAIHDYFLGILETVLQLNSLAENSNIGLWKNFHFKTMRSLMLYPRKIDCT